MKFDSFNFNYTPFSHTYVLFSREMDMIHRIKYGKLFESKDEESQVQCLYQNMNKESSFSMGI